MHRLFHILELVDEILVQCRTSADILHFGLTCKALWDNALLFLWRTDADERKLTCLLPQDIAIIEDPKSGLPYFDRELSASQWGRIRTYTCFIRELTFSDRNRPSNSSWGMSVISTDTDAFSDLFPSLRTLSLDTPKPDTEEMCVRFLNELPLQKLSLDIHRDGPPVTVEFLMSIANSGQLGSLYAFSLSMMGAVGWPIRRDVELAIGKLISKLQSVEEVRAEVYSSASHVISALSLLPSLNCLHLSICGFLPFHRKDDVDVETSSLFPSLRSVCLVQQDEAVPFSKSLLNHISSDNVESASFACITNTCLSGFLSIISTNWYPTLSSINIEWKYDVFAIESGLDLSPLALCFNLTRVSLVRGRVQELSYEHLEPLFGLPRLRNLSIGDNRWGLPIGYFFQPSFLIRLAAGCPTLETLSLPLHFPLGRDLSTAATGTDEPQLRVLQSPKFICAEPDVAADTLKMLFPKLRTFDAIRVDPPEGEKFHRSWPVA